MQELDEHNPNDCKENYMRWLKENDPIYYYEITSNPTGGDGDDDFSFVGFIIVFLIIVSVCYFFFAGK